MSRVSYVGMLLDRYAEYRLRFLERQEQGPRSLLDLKNARNVRRWRERWERHQVGLYRGSWTP